MTSSRLSLSLLRTKSHQSMSGEGSVPYLEPTLEDAAAENFSRVAELGLSAAAERGDAEEIKFLLHAGVHPDSRFEFGTTALMKAAARGHMGVASVLLATGRRKGEMMLKTKERDSADLHLRSADGTTALHFAAYHGHASMCKILIASGAEVDARCKDGETPLMRACYNGHLGCVETLIASGADVNAKSKQHGNTPLILAAGRLHKHVTERLLLAGANVNMPSKFGDTPLMRVAYRGDIELLDILLGAGAQPDDVNTRGKNALDLARERGHKECVDRLFTITEPRSRVRVTVNPPYRPYNVF